MPVTSNGTKDEPQFASSGNAPQFAGDLSTLSTFFASRAFRRKTTVALLAAASGMADGDQAVCDNADGAIYSYNGTAWLLSTTPNAASQAIRDAYFSGSVQPVAGTSVYRTDLGYIQRHNGTTWTAQLIGLVPIVPASVASTGGAAAIGSNGAISVTGTTTALAINGAFTAAFDNYLAIMNLFGSTALNIVARLRASGTDLSSGYNWALNDILYSNTPANAPVGGAADTSITIGRINGASPSPSLIKLDIANPFLTVGKLFDVNGADVNRTRKGGGSNASTASHDGLSIISSSGNFQGNIRLFGYNNN